MLKLILTVLIAIKLADCRDVMVWSQDHDNSILLQGDTCKLKNGSKGICTEVMDCDYVKKLLSSRKNSEIVRCAFQGIIPLVCCPKSNKFENALCGNLKPGITIVDKITNGIRATVGEFPYQAALGQKNIDGQIEFKCGGSIIADDIILTAAHCGNRRDLIPTMVRLGRVSTFSATVVDQC
jgi:hypothetical protein